MEIIERPSKGFHSKEVENLRKSMPDFDQFSSTRLQLYQSPPTETISLIEFEKLAADRLKLLKEVESLGQRFSKYSQQYHEGMESLLQKTTVLDYRGSQEKVVGEEDVRRRRNDHVSHFILRLAFCRSPDSRKWFLQQETDLFKYRFANENRKFQENFLQTHPILRKYETGVVSEKDPDLNEKITNSTGSIHSPISKEGTLYCKVPFTETLELIRSRKVYVHQGLAYILLNDLGVLVSNLFRKEMSLSLVTGCKYYGQIQEGERLEPFLKRVSHNSYVGKDYSVNTSGSKVTAKEVDGLADTSFPLCMRGLHQTLRRDHHLKHGGRMQYGLFLKGIGLSLEEALSFWRNAFAKHTDAEKFDKQYSYNIRHNYGKEGKRKDYTPYSCQKIIMTNPPGPQDAHGCPYKHSDPQLLRQQLQAMRLSTQDINKIVGLSVGGKYDQACSRCLEFSHGIPEKSLPQLISHPNGYFEESQKIRSGKKPASSETAVAN